MMTLSIFIEEFAEVIEVSPEIISNDFDLTSQVNWDSLAFISAIVLIDKHFGVIVDSESLTRIKTFGELTTLFLKKAA